MAIKINLGDADLKKIIISFSFILLGILFLIINELSYIAEVKNYYNSGGKAVEVNVNQPNSSNNNKLVYLNGNLTAEKKVSDGEFEIGVDGLKLKRKTEIYQWQEKKLDNQPTSYEQVWSENLIDSKTFTDTEKINPNTASFASNEFVNEQAKIGAFSLDKNYAYKVSGYESVNLSTLFPKPADVVIDNLYECICINTTVCPNYDKVKAQAKDLKAQIGKIYADKSKYSVKDWRCKKLPNEITSSVVNLKNGFKLEENYAFKGFDYAQPKVGDIRISYEYVPYGQYSVLGKQQGNLITSFASKTALIEAIVLGKVEAKKLYSEPAKKSILIQTLLRLFSLALVFIGFRNLAIAKESLSKISPKLDLIKGYIKNPILITGFVILLFAGIVWLSYSIIIGILILAVAGAIFFFIKKALGGIPPSISSAGIGFIEKIKQALAKKKSSATATTPIVPTPKATSMPSINPATIKTAPSSPINVNAAAAVKKEQPAPIPTTPAKPTVVATNPPAKPTIQSAQSPQNKVQENKVNLEQKPLVEPASPPKVESKKPELPNEFKAKAAAPKVEEKPKEPVKQAEVKKVAQAEVKPEPVKAKEPAKKAAEKPAETKDNNADNKETKQAGDKEATVISAEDRAKFFEQFKKKE